MPLIIGKREATIMLGSGDIYMANLGRDNKLIGMMLAQDEPGVIPKSIGERLPTNPSLRENEPYERVDNLKILITSTSKQSINNFIALLQLYANELED